MKVVFFAPYFYDPARPEFSRNQTGFGKMVHDLAQTIGLYAEITALTHVLTNGEKTTDGKDSYNLYRHTAAGVMRAARPQDFAMAAKTFFAAPGNASSRFHRAFYALDGGAARSVLRATGADAAHIHGIGYSTLPFIRACRAEGIPYLLTLHGLIGLNDTIEVPQYEKDLERAFLLRAAEEKQMVSVISSGMKRRIETEYLQGKPAENIVVIPNGIDLGSADVPQPERTEMTPVQGEATARELSGQYAQLLSSGGVPQDAAFIRTLIGANRAAGRNVAICVGNLTRNKNQRYLPRLVSRMPDEIRSQWFFVVCGNECDGGELRKSIQQTHTEREIFYIGFQSALRELWPLADVNLCLSFNEGFSLPIIEGYAQGVPAVAYADLDSVEDLYAPGCLWKVEGREDPKRFCTALEQAVQGADRKALLEKASRFSLPYVAQQYLTAYEALRK